MTFSLAIFRLLFASRVLFGILIGELVQYVQPVSPLFVEQVFLADDVQPQVWCGLRQVIAQDEPGCDHFVWARRDAEPSQFGRVGVAGFKRCVADEQHALAPLPQRADGVHSAGQGRFAQVDSSVQVKNESVASGQIS